MRLTVIGSPRVDAATCGACGGACCKSFPGLANPDDLGAPDEAALAARVRALLDTGRWAVDWWEGDPRDDAEVTPSQRRELAHVELRTMVAYYLRPAIPGEEGIRLSGSWGRGCTFFREGRGCELEHDDRPHGCRALAPGHAPILGCIEIEDGVMVHKVHYVLAWLPWQRALRAAARGVDVGVIIAEEDADA